MANVLLPKLDDQNLTVNTILKYPQKITDTVAKLSAAQLVFDAFFDAGPPLVGGGLVYSVLLKGSNFSVRDIEERTPGGEYALTYNDTEFDLATSKDLGHKVEVFDEERDRNDAISLANKLVTLANDIAREVDARAIAAIEAALTKYSIASVTGHDWDDLTTVGPLTDITPNADRPTADIAKANLLIKLEDLGLNKVNTLVCHPNQESALAIGYGEQLQSALQSAGITSVRTSTLITPGVAYVVEKGKAGKIAMENPLTTEVIPDRQHRTTFIQSYVQPAFAVSTPAAVRKITGL